MSRYLLGLVAVLFAVSAQAQTLQSGSITAFPLDLGVRYNFLTASGAQSCEAVTSSELTCTSVLTENITLQRYHAVVALQGDKEYIIACPSSDFERNGCTCVNLTPVKKYEINVHSKTVVILGDMFSEVNDKGKVVRTLTPIFSILTELPLVKSAR